MKKCRYGWGVLWSVFCLCWIGGVQAQLPATPFGMIVEPTELALQPAEKTTVRVVLQVPTKHYLYRAETELNFDALEGLKVVAIRYPDAQLKEDPFLGKTVEIYDHDVEIVAELEAPAGLAPGPRTLAATVAFQGCSEKLCFRREERLVEWAVQVGPVGAAPSTDHTSSPTHVAAQSAPQDLFAHGALWTYLLVFLGGVLTSFTPCVLPILPVVLLIIGIDPERRRRNLLLAASLALGLSLTYATIGVVGALAGQPIGFLFQQRWFLVLVVLFFLAMSASMFGVFSLQLPSVLQTRLQRLGGVGPRGAFLAGISTGLLATPCAGPVVAALVTHVGVQRDAVQGFLLLFTYGLGLGTVFMIVGTFYGAIARKLPKGGALRVVKAALGILLLLPAGYYTWALLAPDSRWHTDETVALTTARAAGRPLLIEFTSKTCVPCVIMEQTTFQDPRVVAALATRIVPLRIDTTFTNRTVEGLIERYHVVGWPTLIFAAPDGTLFDDLRLVGEVVSPERLLEVITEAERRTRGGW
ncbi:MAG: thioredoxin family protein [Deltaproteobacteria bacterium]|nr:thioredoxin family protein [Deltaproteobacteria bacterium]